MLDLLFPRVIDNRFRGQWLGLGLLGLVLLLKIVIAVASILAPRSANAADAIDLTTYSAAALRGAMTSTALLGLLHLSVGLFCVFAMIRYRAMVPLIHAWLLAEFLGRRVILAVYPMERTPGTSSGSIVNLVLLSLMVSGLALSVWPRRDAPDRSSDHVREPYP